MLLMRGHGQLADMYLCISRVPSLVKVTCPRAPTHYRCPTHGAAAHSLCIEQWSSSPLH
jgi:hypothetical protein